MEKKTYGYIRVSTIAQHDDRQRLTMEDFGVEELSISKAEKTLTDQLIKRYRGNLSQAILL